MDKGCGVFPGLGEQVLVVLPRLHQCFKIGFRLDFESPLRRHQSLCLLEPTVVGPKNHGHAPHRGFENVVDAGAESAADIGHSTIAIDGRKQSEAINHETIGLRSLLG